MNDLARFKQYFGGYTELRKQTNIANRIAVVNGSVLNNTSQTETGVSARSIKNGSWGMASSPDITDESVKNVIAAAMKNAVLLDSKMSKTVKPFCSRPIKIEKSFASAKPKLSQKERVDICLALDAYIAEKYPSLISRSVRFVGIDVEKTLVTADGTEGYSFVPRSHMYFMMTTEKDGKPIDLFDLAEFGGLGEFEDYFYDIERLYPSIDNLYEELMKKREGVYASGGIKTCVLHPDLAGMLAHEAVGHTVESDSVLSGSIAGPMFGKKVASEIVSMTDFAHTAFGKTVDCPVYFDDEGLEAEDQPLIENGILTGYMQNKYNAAEMGHTPKGNARAFLFSDEPLIRMRNTFIIPGKSKLEDMIASVDDGYYLISSSNGQADSTSEFTFGINMGYEIKNGRIGRAILDTTVSGVAFDMLKTISMVSGDCKMISAGMCGKKQPMSVTMGGPAIKCEITIGGR